MYIYEFKISFFNALDDDGYSRTKVIRANSYLEAYNQMTSFAIAELDDTFVWYTPFLTWTNDPIPEVTNV